ncbi:transcription factor-like protein [Blastocystis sp. subtype 4]|uniref:transcription factor-like protein n=1 Tax=Blastocystis sp. subtype 4 TaxID=944170 RepID=UPI00071182B0|nr:transcription factor-like protein [Blastocystis sp. subtype 4]KNB42462.1 transcription factor-like protein [Blastocystis sp. subtype 4]|eukprot:XP_014525905.1 transcription factor-like protein [Blastocystis sp. subtype 4]
MLVKEHTTGDPKKNDNIRRRVYDALSVIHAVGLAEKRGKTFIWMGRPSIPQPDNSSAIKRKLGRDLIDKRVSLIRLIKRAVGLEYLRMMKRGGAKSTSIPSANSDFGGMSPGGILGLKSRVDGRTPLGNVNYRDWRISASFACIVHRFFFSNVDGNRRKLFRSIY